MTASTQNLFEEAIAMSKDSDYVFASDRGSKHIIVCTLGKALKALQDDTDMTKWILRDLRRTVKTLAGLAGLSKEIRDRLQNHALNDVSSKHYDRHFYIEEKKEALLKWESFLKEKGVKLLRE